MLQESDIKYRTLVDEVNDGIYICDLKGTFVYANRALAYILGFKRPADIIGRSFLEFLPPEKRNGLNEQYRIAMSTGINSALITIEIIRQDSTIAFIEIKPVTFIKGGKMMGNQGVVRDITERKQEEVQRMCLSMHDSLTGLYNRTFFDAEMKRLERGRQFPISILIVNVGNLKDASDLEHPEAGDKRLKQVARVLFNSFRGDDIVTRIGEDKFAILLPSVDENAVETIIKRIRESLQKKYRNESETALEFYIGASTTKEGVGVKSVLKQAEIIAYLETKKNKIT